MRAFGAMLIDAYRELNSRKLFWVVLVISTMVMLFYASIAFDDTGMSFFFGLWHVDSDFVRADTPIARMLYRSIFSSFIVGFWLAWAAVILALISTTTIFPDFIAGGSIDLVLSKPLSRVFLFFSKYISSLLFVVLQVAIFCVGVFLCMGVRMGEWNWMIFAAIPLITLFYSYLYSFNVLIGVWTRSALAALLLTMLLWFSIFGINMTEGIMLRIQVGQQISLDDSRKNLDRLENAVEALGDSEEDAGRAAMFQSQIADEKTTIAETEDQLGKLEPWMKRVQVMKYPLPKTGETLGLLERWLQKDTDVSLNDILAGNITMDEDGEYVRARTGHEERAQTRMMEYYDSRTMWYILGTSMVFEAVMLGLACFIFVRRDF